MKQFEFIGKKRTFKRVKMSQLMDMQIQMQEAQQKADTGQGQLLAMGEVVAQFIEGFEPDEMLEADIEEYYLSQGLHLIATYMKHNRTKTEIEELKKRIVDAAIEMQLKGMMGLDPNQFR